MKKFIISLTVIFSVICCFCLPVSAAVEPDIEFFDFDDYAIYSYNSSNGIITADIQLPTSWRWSYARDDDGYSQWANSFDFTTVEMWPSIIIDYNPFARATYETVLNHVPIYSGHFLDLQYIPSGAKLNIEFITQMDISNTYSNFADIFVAYVDSTGKVVSHVIIPTTLNVIDMGNNRLHYAVLGSYTFNSVPDNATGCFYLVHTTTNSTDYGVEIPIVNIKSSLIFTYSEQSYNIKQNQIIRDKVSNIEKQLGDIVNGSIEPNSPPGQEDFDELHDNEQQLIEQSQNYLNNGLSFLQNASAVIFGLGNGFQAIKVLVQPVFALPFANSLISVSISLGLIATLIGVAISSISNGKGEAKAGKKGSNAGKKK